MAASLHAANEYMRFIYLEQRAAPAFGIRRASVADTNELLERLTAAVGMIMEDNGPVALTPMPCAGDELEARLAQLEQACRDGSALIQAAQVLARRRIR